MRCNIIEARSYEQVSVERGEYYVKDCKMIDLIIEYPYEFLVFLGIFAFGAVLVVHGFNKV